MISAYIYEWELRFFAMRRSGHHAVIEWFRGLFDDVLVVNQNAGQLDPLVAMPELRFSPRQCLIYNLEDANLAVNGSDYERKTRSAAIGPSRHIFEVLVLRDPLNTFASRVRKAEMGWEELAHNPLELWIGHAKEFVGDTSHLRNKLLVNYNAWFTNEDYRIDLARSVGRPFSDKGLHVVPPYGGGSSFDELHFDGSAQQMDVLNRWQRFKDKPYFRELFENETLWRLTEAIFGPLPEASSLRSRHSSHTLGVNDNIAAFHVKTVGDKQITVATRFAKFDVWIMDHVFAFYQDLPYAANVIDIGGHCGYFACAYKARYPASNVFMYEPYEPNFRMAEKNFQLNGVSVHGYHGAVIGRETCRYIHVLEEHNLGRVVCNDKPSGISVTACFEINAVLDGKDDLIIKIDAEGAEWSILTSITEENWKRIKRIVGEWHPLEDSAKGQCREWEHFRPLLRNLAVSNPSGHYFTAERK